MPNLQSFREQIDALDEQIIRILGERFGVVRQVGAYKADTGIAVIQPDRIRQIMERCTVLGHRYGVRPELLHQLYDLIIRESCALEEKDQLKSSD